MQRGKGYNMSNSTELIEVITHPAFYAGWPKAISVITVTKELFSKQK